MAKIPNIVVGSGTDAVAGLKEALKALSPKKTATSIIPSILGQEAKVRSIVVENKISSRIDALKTSSTQCC